MKVIYMTQSAKYLYILFFLIIVCGCTKSVNQKNVRTQGLDNAILKCDKTLLKGQLIIKPGTPLFKFYPAKLQSEDNLYMTHTIFYILTKENKIYGVSLDNLFYKYANSSQAKSDSDEGIIRDFYNRFKVGDPVAACGDIYTYINQEAIHWVHPATCGKGEKGGYLLINGIDISNNTNYCNCNCRRSHKKRVLKDSLFKLN